MIYSFDVFDTLITRSLAEPRGIFVLMQNSLEQEPRFQHLEVDFKRNFATIRERAIELARREYCRNDMEEVTLEQIYEAVRLTANLTDEDVAELIRLECDLEIENVVGISVNIERVKTLIQQGERVVLVSDMYLDESTVRAMLVKCDEVFNNVKLYLSSAIKKLKSGKLWQASLYRYVLEQEQIQPCEMVHIGDDPRADIDAAIWAGIMVDPYLQQKESALFRSILETNEHNLIAEYAMGVARNLARENRYDVPGRAGCFFSGYILYAYVDWLLRDAINRNIHRLYFIARDGFILHQIANIIIKESHVNMDVFYIYGSRRAWRMASYNGGEAELREILTLSSLNEVFTVKQYADILQISLEAFIKWFPEFDKLEEVSILSFYKMTDIVCKNKDFRDYLVESNKEKHELLKRYLQNTIDTEDGDFAFVDVNGSGNSQICISKVIGEFYKGVIHNYFFKMDRMNKREDIEFHCYSSGSADLDMIIETMTRNLDEQTVGYQLNETGEVVPVFSGNEANQLRAYGYKEYEQSVIAFAHAFSKILKRNRLITSRALTNAYMQGIMNHPESEEFLYFANMPFNNSGRAENAVPFAPRLEKRDLKEIFLYHLDENLVHYYSGTSLEMSLCRRTEDEKKMCAEYFCMDFGTRRKFRECEGRSGEDFPFPGKEKVPFELLGERIVIYGAGKYGNAIYNEIINSGKRVIAWFDKNASKIKGNCIVTDDVSILANTDYDCIIVAVLYVYWARQIEEQLVARGIPKEKIYCPALEV